MAGCKGTAPNICVARKKVTTTPEKHQQKNVPEKERTLKKALKAIKDNPAPVIRQ